MFSLGVLELGELELPFKPERRRGKFVVGRVRFHVEVSALDSAKGWVEAKEPCECLKHRSLASTVWAEQEAHRIKRKGGGLWTEGLKIIDSELSELHYFAIEMACTILNTHSEYRRAIGSTKQSWRKRSALSGCAESPPEPCRSHLGSTLSHRHVCATAYERR